MIGYYETPTQRKTSKRVAHRIMRYGERDAINEQLEDAAETAAELRLEERAEFEAYMADFDFMFSAPPFEVFDESFEQDAPDIDEWWMHDSHYAYLFYD